MGWITFPSIAVFIQKCSAQSLLYIHTSGFCPVSLSWSQVMVIHAMNCENSQPFNDIHAVNY